jgi:hypothetical protein
MARQFHQKNSLRVSNVLVVQTACGHVFQSRFLVARAKILYHFLALRHLLSSQ